MVVAWDVNQDTLDGIKGGSINSTIAQKPFTMGYVGLKQLDGIFHNPPSSLGKDTARMHSRRSRCLSIRVRRLWISATWMRLLNLRSHTSRNFVDRIRRFVFLTTMRQLRKKQKLPYFLQCDLRAHSFESM